MSSYRLVAADEWPHAPGDDAHFNESVYERLHDGKPVVWPL